MIDIAPTTHSDFIFSVTRDWVLLPILAVIAAVIIFIAYRKRKK